MRLYGYWRSSATYRVRIALALKGLDFEYRPVNLLKNEQHSDEYRAISPQGLVPALNTAEGARLTQSLAIIEYLEEVHPHPPRASIARPQGQGAGDRGRHRLRGSALR